MRSSSNTRRSRQGSEDAARALRDGKGRAYRMIGSTGDISELKDRELELRRARDEAQEALEQQTATAEILKVISSSPADIEPVFRAILGNAVRLCEASVGAVFTYDGEVLTNVAHQNASPEFAEYLARSRPRPSRETTTRRCALERRTVHTADLLNDPEYTPPEFQRRENVRAVLSVPMMRDDRLVGVITLWRREVRAFSDKQIALIQTFADQALIAIENVRLFNETREALEQQKASGEVLAAIGGSIGDTKAVFDKILESCGRLFAGKIVGLNLVGEDGMVRLGAFHGPGRAEFEKIFPVPLDPRYSTGRAIAERRVVHYRDVENDDDVRETARLGCRAIGIKSIVFAPVMWEGRGLGSIFAGRDHVSDFTEKETALLRSFADQAAIAIQNSRLLNETKEALDCQTATGEILASISGSITDTKPVFDAIARNLLRVFGTRFAVVELLRDGQIEVAALRGEPGFERLAQRYPRPLDAETIGGAAMLSGKIVQCTPVIGTPGIPADIEQLARDFGFDSCIGAPMIRDDKVIGAVCTAHRTPIPFSDKQLALLRTFADQAVIAIENARLFNETREALEQQKAVRGVLETLSRSAFDLDAVLHTLIESTTRLSHAEKGFIFRRDADLFRFAVDFGASEEFRDFIARNPVAIDPGTLVGRTALEGRTVHIEDALSDPRFTAKAAQALGRFRTMLGVPIVRDRTVIGVIALWKERVEPFTDAQIALVTGFSSQASIAIENARLFNETREALDFQKATGEILASISGSITEAKPVFDQIARDVLRLFGTRFASVQVLRDGQIEVIAAHGDPGFARITQLYPRALDTGTIGGSVILSGNVVQFTPVIGNPDSPVTTENMAHDFGFDSVIGAPMIRDHKVVGAIVTAHRAAIPFSDKQVALLRTFADQAVIAIENARLFNETKEALERQTATAEILRVISGSMTDTQPVFDAIVRNCQRLFGGRAVALVMPNGAMLKSVAFASEGNVEGEEESLKPWPLDRGSAGGTCILDSRVIALPDIAEAVHTYPRIKQLALDLGYRSALFVPLMREGKAIACLAVLRATTGDFEDKEVSLASTFADQAVIAIENVRLFNETREALERQKALAEVLGTISGSVADTKPVFDKILDSCQRLFEGHLVGLTLAGEDGMVYLGAYKGENREQMEQVYPYRLDRDSGSGLAMLDRKVVHFADVDAPGSRAPRHVLRGAQAAGFKAIIFAPLIGEGRAVGALWVGRRAPGPFSAEQTALLKTFADQAVIAIQNTRLFREAEDKSRQLEIANRHKSEFLANVSHELRTPLNAIIGFTRIVMRRSKEQLEPKQYENLEKILLSGHNLLALINAILDLSKVEAGRVELYPAEIELVPVLEHCVRTIEPLIDDDSVALIREFDAALPRLVVDEEKLRQIVINMLSNAAKFTRSGSIRVCAHAANGQVDIAVADTGIGIAADKLASIFEAFEQAGASTTRDYEGTGLGLTIARRYAQLMGGDIAVRSTLGSGSVFTLTLPVRLQA